MHPALSRKLWAPLAGVSVIASVAACDVTIKDGEIKGVSVSHKV